MSYNVFHRTWWIHNPSWPDGKEPGAGQRHYIARNINSIDVARDLAQDWNSTHDPGFLSDKAEFEED